MVDFVEWYGDWLLLVEFDVIDEVVVVWVVVVVCVVFGCIDVLVNNVGYGYIVLFE